uniref:DRBM domain-containing protein n=1 Tax=Zea mays TaxID=4577 RepID=A0A804UCN5_MAIZE
MPTAVPTPKAVVHQRFGAKARYTVEEVREDVGGCPGLAPQTRNVYRCALDLPGLSVATPGTFLRKKDAEQAAAQIALDKLGIHPTANSPTTPQEAWAELIARISGFFIDESEKPYSPEAVDSALERWSGTTDPVEVEAVLVPHMLEDELKTVRINLRDNEHYMSYVAAELSAIDSSHVLVSRTIGKTSSEIRLYFAAANIHAVSDMSKHALDSLGDGDINWQVNKRASYICGQTIYGDALLANIGYTRRDSELHTEDVNLCSYYRILLGKLPDGNCKMSRDSILAAELPSAYSRFSWKGLSPRDLLCSFCRLQRLPEPHFAVSRVSCDTLMSAVSSEERGAPAGSAENQYTNDVRINKEKPDLFKCEVNIRSRKQEVLLEYSAADTWSKESDAIQNSSLKVLIWFNNYFKKLTSKTGKLYLSESTAGVKCSWTIFYGYTKEAP